MLSLLDASMFFEMISDRISLRRAEALSFIAPCLSMILSIESITYGYVFTGPHNFFRIGYFVSSFDLKKFNIARTVSSDLLRS